MAFVIYLGSAILSSLLIFKFNEIMLLLVFFIVWVVKLWASYFMGLKGNVATRPLGIFTFVTTLGII